MRNQDVEHAVPPDFAPERAHTLRETEISPPGNGGNRRGLFGKTVLPRRSGTTSPGRSCGLTPAVHSLKGTDPPTASRLCVSHMLYYYSTLSRACQEGRGEVLLASSPGDPPGEEALCPSPSWKKPPPGGAPAIKQYQIESYLPKGKGRRIVKIPRPFFLTSTALIKDNKILPKTTQRHF